MKIAKEEKENVVLRVMNYLEEANDANRKDIIEYVLSEYKFLDNEKNNKSPNSKYNIIRSFIGTVITDMLSKNIIGNKNNKYFIKKEREIVIEEEHCRNVLLNFLNSKPYTKKDLYSALQAHFETDKTETISDDNALKGLAGNLLNELLSQGKIVLTDDKYSLAKNANKNKYPKLPLAEDVFEKCFLERLCECGGKFFEKFVSNLLEKYFIITGREVLDCEVVGGSNDGGIDVIIDTLDELGFRERIMVQAKCRQNMLVSEKEIREFYGALNALGGSRGIFITTSSFHPNAEKLLLTIDNCVGIDGHKIFGLMKNTTYGIRKNKNGYLFDETIFNIQ